MSFDIYGNALKFGYCEVHPNIGESYPCSQCFREHSQREEEYYKAQEEAYYEDYHNAHADKLCEQEIPF